MQWTTHIVGPLWTLYDRGHCMTTCKIKNSLTESLIANLYT